MKPSIYVFAGRICIDIGTRRMIQIQLTKSWRGFGYKKCLLPGVKKFAVGTIIIMWTSHS